MESEKMVTKLTPYAFIFGGLSSILGDIRGSYIMGNKIINTYTCFLLFYSFISNGKWEHGIEIIFGGHSSILGDIRGSYDNIDIDFREQDDLQYKNFDGHQSILRQRIELSIYIGIAPLETFTLINY